MTDTPQPTTEAGQVYDGAAFDPTPQTQAGRELVARLYPEVKPEGMSRMPVFVWQEYDALKVSILAIEAEARVALTAQLADRDALVAALVEVLSHFVTANYGESVKLTPEGKRLLSDLAPAAAARDAKLVADAVARELSVERIAAYLHANNLGCQFGLDTPEDAYDCREVWHLNDAELMRAALLAPEAPQDGAK